MISSPLLIAVAAIVANLIASSKPEVPTEAYVLSYLLVTLLISWHLSITLGSIAGLTTLGLINFVFFIVTGVLTAIRRLFFSPLARYPGPLIAALSGVWLVNEARTGRGCRTYRALHERYKNDIIRIGPNELSINKVDALERLYSHNYTRGTYNQMFNVAGAENLASLREPTKHALYKRIWMKAFARTALRTLVQNLQTHVDRLIESLRITEGEPVDCGRLLDSFAFDVIADLALSQDSGLQQGHGDRTAVEFIHKSLFPISILGHLRHLQQILRYLPPNVSSAMFSKIRDNMFNAHEASASPTSSPRDIFDHLSIPDPKTGLTMDMGDRRQHIPLILTVGAHSISTTLTCIVAALASRPEVQKRILHELTEASGTADGFPPLSTLSRLVYLDSVVREGLRMFPPLRAGSPAITPAGGVTLDTGEFIPPHTQVWIGQYVLMYDERNFPRAGEFLPERWLDRGDGEDSIETVGDRRAWIPFGYGAHACGGKMLALEELKLVLARVVKEFEIQFTKEGGQAFDYAAWADKWKDHFLTAIERIDLVFVPRTNR